MKWPTSGLYINELIDKMLKKFKAPRNGYQEGQQAKLIKLKQAAADANILTVDELIDYLHER